MKQLTLHTNLRLFKLLIGILMLLLLSSSVVYAEFKTVFVPPSGYSFVQTWQSGQHGDSENRASYAIYFQSLHGRGWSNAGKAHIVSQKYESVYNYHLLEMTATGPLIGTNGHGTTQHYFNDTPPGGSTALTYTSHDGAHSSSTCFYSGC